MCSSRLLKLVVLALMAYFSSGAFALSAAEVRADVALAQDAFERVHPGYERYASANDLAQQWQSIIDDANRDDGMSLETLYLRLQQVLANIRCDHTKAELPAAMDKARKTDPVYLPLRFALVNSRALVLAVAPQTDVAINEEIMAIDGIAMADLIARYSPLISVDGFTDHVREDELANSTEFPGGAIEHFMALEGVTPTATLTLANAHGTTRTATVERIGLAAQRELPIDLDGPSNFADAVSLDIRHDGVAVLTVDTFVNYRQTVKPDTIFAPLFGSIKDAGVTHLIVDLRLNGGGSDDARDRLFAHLITERAELVHEIQARTLDLTGLREHITTWEKRALHPSRLWFKKLDDKHYRLRTWMVGLKLHIKPAKNAYDGKLTVLTSTQNSSGSTLLIGALQALGRAHLVGERTGGNLAGPTAGTVFFLTLPVSKIVLRLPVLRSVTLYDPADRGLGVKVDTLVERSFDDARAGRDVVMQRALAQP